MYIKLPCIKQNNVLFQIKWSTKSKGNIMFQTIKYHHLHGTGRKSHFIDRKDINFELQSHWLKVKYNIDKYVILEQTGYNNNNNS